MLIEVTLQDGSIYVYHVKMNKDLVAYKVMGQANFIIRWESAKLIFDYGAAGSSLVHHEVKNLMLNIFYDGNIDYLKKKRN